MDFKILNLSSNLNLYWSKTKNLTIVKLSQ